VTAMDEHRRGREPVTDKAAEAGARNHLVIPQSFNGQLTHLQLLTAPVSTGCVMRT
jgi:hypothetical protein